MSAEAQIRNPTMATKSGNPEKLHLTSRNGKDQNRKNVRSK